MKRLLLVLLFSFLLVKIAKRRLTKLGNVGMIGLRNATSLVTIKLSRGKGGA